MFFGGRWVSILTYEYKYVDTDEATRQEKSIVDIASIRADCNYDVSHSFDSRGIYCTFRFALEI